MKTYETVRGMRDFLPEELGRRQRIEDEVRRLFRLFGYREIETPVVESFSLLSAKSGEEIRHRMYMFKDLGGRRIALRPEMTASVARIVATKLRSDPKPLRLGYIANCFRYDNPQMGRYREFWQAGYELFGSNRPEADAEILAICHDLLRDLGLDVSIKLGHVGILRGILTSEGVNEANQNIIMGLLDRGQTRTSTKMMKDLGVKEVTLKAIGRLQNLKGSDTEAILRSGEDEIHGNEAACLSLMNLRSIAGLARSAGVMCPIIVDLGFTRGLDYYTGMIFEFFSPQLAIALGGGGRYDRLVETFGGESTPAVGCSPGIDRIALAMEKSGLFNGLNSLRDGIMVVPIGEAQSAVVLELASKLRKADISVQVEVSGRNVRDALSYASGLGFVGMLLVGPREAASGKVTLRDLISQVQHEVSFEGVVEAVKTLLQ
ncbi:histidine--tRNA ligase [Candidatus Bathyarchaeota archaeon]|nr:histidine--tRNA ligase [Candidatus Bathyarchaeota archaeon]